MWEAFYSFARFSPLKDLLHRCDRGMIYIFIAGSYFPWLTIKQFPDDGWSSSMKWFVWLLAILGVTYQQAFHEKYKNLEIFFYLVIGMFPALPIITEVCHNLFFYIVLLLCVPSQSRA